MTQSRPVPLPTPPNSISPALPPHGLKAQLQKARLEPIDSDLDLHEGRRDPIADHASPDSPPYESAGTIAPAMLAKFHLPEILLNHGPLAIRHIMGYLTTSVPGFAAIPPAKARRLVVSALEGRGAGGDGGGIDGDVEFEKVGWGRWDARRRGQPPRDPAAARQLSPTSAPYHGGIPITKGMAAWDTARPRQTASGSSPEDGDWAAFSQDDCDITMLENEADKMSMDGSASASCSEAPDDDVAMNDDPEDVTDDEDWGAVGAAALRAASYNNSAQGRTDRNHLSSHVYTSGGGLRSFSANAGMARPPQLNDFNPSASTLGNPSDAQEREAVEALLRLGSV